MRISLNDQASEFVEEQVRAGRYGSPKDVVNAALTQMMQAEEEGDFAPGELDALLAEAEQDFARGDYADAETVFAEIRQMSKSFRKQTQTQSRSRRK